MACYRVNTRRKSDFGWVRDTCRGLPLLFSLVIISSPVTHTFASPLLRCEKDPSSQQPGNGFTYEVKEWLSGTQSRYKKKTISFAFKFIFLTATHRLYLPRRCMKQSSKALKWTSFNPAVNVPLGVLDVLKSASLENGLRFGEQKNRLAPGQVAGWLSQPCHNRRRSPSKRQPKDAWHKKATTFLSKPASITLPEPVRTIHCSKFFLQAQIICGRRPVYKKGINIVSFLDFYKRNYIGYR
jgi:hypothetical protein